MLKFSVKTKSRFLKANQTRDQKVFLLIYEMLIWPFLPHHGEEGKKKKKYFH